MRASTYFTKVKMVEENIKIKRAVRKYFSYNQDDKRSRQEKVAAALSMEKSDVINHMITFIP